MTHILSSYAAADDFWWPLVFSWDSQQKQRRTLSTRPIFIGTRSINVQEMLFKADHHLKGDDDVAWSVFIQDGPSSLLPGVLSVLWWAAGGIHSFIHGHSSTPVPFLHTLVLRSALEFFIHIWSTLSKPSSHRGDSNPRLNPLHESKPVSEELYFSASNV